MFLTGDVIRKGEKRTRLSDCMVGEAGRSWQGIEESSTLLNITTSPRDSVPPTPHNLTLGSLVPFSQFLGIFLGNPEFLPLDTIALSCPPHLNSAILDLKRLRLLLICKHFSLDLTMTLHFEPGDDQDVDLVTEMVHM